MYRIRAIRRTTKNPPIVNPAISLIIHINAAIKNGNNAIARITAAIVPRILRKVSIIKYNYTVYFLLQIYEKNLLSQNLVLSCECGMTGNHYPVVTRALL